MKLYIYMSDYAISLPFMMIIAGSAGYMKTTTCFSIINAMPDTFRKIVIFTRNKDKLLYHLLKENLPEIEIYEDLSKLQDIDKDFDKTVNNLIIFDELELEKQPGKIEEYAIRCRTQRLSMMYLTQDYCRSPNVIIKNSNYLILKDIPKKCVLDKILRDYLLGIDKDTLVKLYEHAVNDKDKTHWFMIDLNESDDSPYKFRRDFSPIKYALE
jgi:hypothetical protein